jgi:hypothetical protein
MSDSKSPLAELLLPVSAPKPLIGQEGFMASNFPKPSNFMCRAPDILKRSHLSSLKSLKICWKRKRRKKMNRRKQ